MQTTHEPEQLTIDDEFESWEEWFASLPSVLPRADDEDEAA